MIFGKIPIDWAKIGKQLAPKKAPKIGRNDDSRSDERIAEWEGAISCAGIFRGCPE